jgi:O-antigen/teichoic acid export membrane protein
VSVITTLLGIPVTIGLAYLGWSYWSMVISGVFTGILSLAIFWIISPWKPKFRFSQQSFKEFFSFGYKLSLTGCVWQVYNEIIHFVIGKFYSPAQLAIYHRANHLAKLPETMLFHPLSSIMFPILSTIHDDTVRLNQVYKKYLRICLMPMMWIMFTMVASANSIIRLLYGETWMGCVPYLQVLCVGFSIVPLVLVNHSYLCVKGRSDLLLKREINVRVVGIVLMLCAAYHSVMAICWAYTAFSLYNTYITMRYTRLVSQMSIRDQLKDFVPYLGFSILVNLPALFIWWIGVPYYICAFCGPFLSLVLYLLIMHFRHDDAYIMLRDTLWNSGPIRKLRTRFIG